MSLSEVPPTGQIAVVIPCYRVRAHILDVIERIGPEVTAIYVVDDCCPEQTGAFVREASRDSRVRVIMRTVNGGVGAATLSGYRQALADGMTVIVKIDGDGQMDPALLPIFVRPILEGRADYTKGNRFFNLDDVRTMPTIRLFGNAVLSFMTKLSTGYWTLFDPTNGYTAIHANVLRQLPLNSISTRYFFESDMLFRLGILRACVLDIPMTAIYAEEQSNLRIRAVLFGFLKGHLRNLVKRIVYSYFVRDFSIASVELVVGLLLLGFGTIFGFSHWWYNAHHDVVTTSGTVMLSALPVILGLQIFLSFLGFDIAAVPQTAIHRLLDSTIRSGTKAHADVSKLPAGSGKR